LESPFDKKTLYFIIKSSFGRNLFSEMKGDIWGDFRVIPRRALRPSE